MYINDLPTCVHNKVRFYADDVLLYSYVYSEDDCISLQQDLNAGHTNSKCFSIPKSVNFYKTHMECKYGLVKHEVHTIITHQKKECK